MSAPTNDLHLVFEVAELEDRTDDLVVMARTLALRGFGDVANETVALAAAVAAYHSRTEAQLNRLRGAWRAIEMSAQGWTDSQVAEAVARCRDIA